ncbi:uncharacterized protein VTP21DRAFT_196 [Calcarisporiella thermophila]|uniref:uncharacterized protein n=1 Tax=Calcarisporiella thermophila TaxID=911321 RepID=UPI0037443314
MHASTYIQENLEYKPNFPLDIFNVNYSAVQRGTYQINLAYDAVANHSDSVLLLPFTDTFSEPTPVLDPKPELPNSWYDLEKQYSFSIDASPSESEMAAGSESIPLDSVSLQPDGYSVPTPSASWTSFARSPDLDTIPEANLSSPLLLFPLASAIYPINPWSLSWGPGAYIALDSTPSSSPQLCPTAATIAAATKEVCVVPALFAKGSPWNVDRPYRCDQCSQSFHRNHDLKRHRRIHDQIKPFSCTVCSKKFSRRDALKRHTTVRKCGLTLGKEKSAQKLTEKKI